MKYLVGLFLLVVCAFVLANLLALWAEAIDSGNQVVYGAALLCVAVGVVVCLREVKNE